MNLWMAVAIPINVASLDLGRDCQYLYCSLVIEGPWALHLTLGSNRGIGRVYLEKEWGRGVGLEESLLGGNTPCILLLVYMQY